jgi:hypothetical protein
MVATSVQDFQVFFGSSFVAERMVLLYPQLNLGGFWYAIGLEMLAD